jgi:hypothetical integral membrane protein (TIGR02206 family)
MYYGYLAVNGQLTFPAHIPLELCDLSLFLAILVQLTRSKLAFDLAYYWGIAGAGMAALTPNLPVTAPLYLTIQYFLDHGFIVASILFILWSRHARPRHGSVWRAMLALNLYAACVGTFDYFYKTDYMFLCEKPPTITLLTFLGPWPWYIFFGEFVALLLCTLLYLPFRSQPEAGK